MPITTPTALALSRIAILSPPIYGYVSWLKELSYEIFPSLRAMLWNECSIASRCMIWLLPVIIFPQDCCFFCCALTRLCYHVFAHANIWNLIVSLENVLKIKVLLVSIQILIKQIQCCLMGYVSNFNGFSIWQSHNEGWRHVFLTGYN